MERSDCERTAALHSGAGVPLDRPYGINFNSNFQWSTTSRDVKDGNPVHITREPAQVKAFCDTWRDGIRSYLLYLRDRLTVACDLLAETDADIQQCFPAMHALRPHLVVDEFVARVRRQQQAGYTLAVLRAAHAVKSVAGFRILDYLAWGTILSIDDFVTIPDEQRQGYGGQLLRWVVAHARSQGCDAVHLDSGYQRHEAHRLYLNTGFTLSLRHFALSLKEPVQ